MSDYDAIIVGAGFGGLGAALHLAENGARVALLERTAYPGGCACTFQKGDASYEGGATLFSGFDEGQLFRRWIETHSMDVEFELLDPPLELRAPSGVTFARRDRDALRAHFEALPGAPVKGLRGFFRLQEKVAAALWPTLEDAKLLPPLTPARVLRHAVRLPRYFPLARLAGRPLIRVLERFGLQDFRPLVTWLDAQCQITIQCGVAEAEAPFALAALDYHHRGAVHVKGGIGRLAWAMAEAVDRSGGVVRFSIGVKSATRAEDGRWSVTARGATYRAPWILFNTLPQDAARIAGIDHPGLHALAERVGTGWSAGMLYRTLLPPRDAGPGARHLELVADESKPFLEGNHVFLSIGAEGRGSRRQPCGAAPCPPTSTLRASTAGPRTSSASTSSASRTPCGPRSAPWPRSGTTRSPSSRDRPGPSPAGPGAAGASWGASRAGRASASTGRSSGGGSRRGSAWWGTASSGPEHLRRGGGGRAGRGRGAVGARAPPLSSRARAARNARQSGGLRTPPAQSLGIHTKWGAP